MPPAWEVRTKRLFVEQQRVHCERVDQLFVALLGLQWLACVVTAVWISPLTWTGDQSYTHPHLQAAVLLGGALVFGPLGCVLRTPKTRLTGYVIAIAQMLFSALLIHLTGGRIETHFHVFGSLAFLAFYRERRVLITAAIVIAADHGFRGLLFPQSVFGPESATAWRTLEHTGWILFEVVFLLISITRSRQELYLACSRQAQLEASHDTVEAAVAERTCALAASEARLGVSQEKLRLLINQALDAIITIDDAGIVDEWNPQATIMFGWARRDSVGRHIAEMPQVLQVAYSKAMSQVQTCSRENNDSTLMKTWACDRSGREFPVELTFWLVKLEQRTLFSVFVRDLTQHKQVEAALVTAREAALLASRLKSEFLANMSHEIRTPMNGIIGMIGILLSTELSSEQREFAETVCSSAESLLSIINDILDISKIEAGMLDIESIPFNLQKIVEEVGDLLAVRAVEKKIELIVRYAPGSPRWLLGDGGRIRQVLTNLASNAIKFTQTGQVLIDVDCNAIEEHHASLQISVVDSGIGIQRDKLAHVFGKFTQADASTTRRYGGTGLGLAIAKQLVELMGGVIGVVSAVGQGSTFWFRLKLPLSRELESPAPRANNLMGCHVLVVDDNPVNCRVVAEQVQGWGMRSRVLTSAREALAELYQAQTTGDPYQIAIVDHQMPEMDGLSLARAIRSDARLSKVVLIMLSSTVRATNHQLAELEIAACLVKPARAGQLRQTLATAWAAACSSSSSAVPSPGLPALNPALASRPSSKSQTAKRVLLAEDNLVNQKVATRLLEGFGCQVDVAVNGREAVEMAATHLYDMVFMDCQMPELDGEQATMEIRRQLAHRPRIPIVAMTASAMLGDRERCLAAGMDDYVPKPISKADLSAALQRWMS